MTAPSPSAYSGDPAGHGTRGASPWPGWAPYLAEIPLFSNLSKRHLKSLARLADLRWYADGKTLVRAGAPGDAFFAIFKGEARLETPTGHTRTLTADESFGELALIDGAPRAATVVSVGGVSVARIERAGFLKLLKEEPEIASELARSVVAVVRDLQGGGPRSQPARPESVGRGSPPPQRAAGADLLAAVPLFAGLSRRHLRRVARLAEPAEYAAGAVVARAGARGSTFHVVVAGRAEAVTPGGDAKTLDPGDCFGELSLLDGGPRAATVTALADLTTLRIGRADFLRLMREEPGVATGVLRGLVALVRELQKPAAG